jgi:hypothetical protein
MITPPGEEKINDTPPTTHYSIVKPAPFLKPVPPPFSTDSPDHGHFSKQNIQTLGSLDIENIAATPPFFLFRQATRLPVFAEVVALLHHFPASKCGAVEIDLFSGKSFGFESNSSAM